jgi:hypothetical protein
MNSLADDNLQERFGSFCLQASCTEQQHVHSCAAATLQQDVQLWDVIRLPGTGTWSQVTGTNLYQVPGTGTLVPCTAGMRDPRMDRFPGARRPGS